MTLTWSENHPRTVSAARRVLTFTLAAGACSLLAYMAFSQRFSVITALISDVSPITIVPPEEPVTPPPTPPRAQPPEIQRQAPANIDAPPTPTFDPSSIEPVETSPPGPIYLDATFIERPNGRDFARLYPRRALERGVSGNVLLDCSVAVSGRLSCAIASEDPSGWGFGAASLTAAREFQVAPATADGQPTAGGRLRVPINWRLS
ncbi:MAG: energy transducer TonB [Hyphomonadaceae bacterium]|nr:energy transducer TonB [Hyphomonadaceae bacterium]